MSRNGFSLVELVVVLAIMGTLLSIVALDFNSMQKKHYIEKQCHEIMNDIVYLRMQAMTRKQQYSVTINQGDYFFKRYSTNEPTTAGTTILSKNVPYQLTDKTGNAYSGSKIIFDEMGFTGSGASFGQTIVIGPVDSSASVNCVVISNARVNVGKMNGANCEFK